MDEQTISIEAAAAMTGLSRSTLWRRLAAGQMGKGGNDVRNRALLRLPEVLALLNVELSAEEVQTLLQADAGAAEAQAETGEMFYVAGARNAALYWLHKAAEQGDADAMQWLGIAYAEDPGGRGGARDSIGGAEGTQPSFVDHVDCQGGGAWARDRAAAA